MLFNSIIFITLFLPVSLVGWYILQKLENSLFAKVFLIGMSLWFYGYYNPWYLIILLCSILGNYGCSILFERKKEERWRKGILIAGIFFNLGIFFYFKYFNFFIDNCNYFLHTDIYIETIALPLGISFFTFQQISFVIDRYRGTAPGYCFVDYVCFVTYFPQLIAGPIVLHSEFLPELTKRKNKVVDWELFYDGVMLFILGLGKKVLLADMLAVVVNAEFENVMYLDAPSAWVTIICYMLELYFDFSGYCDMARGCGKMFGFHLPENFNSPLLAVSVSDFWRRWHMTLSRFLTAYIYIPLGGNRRGRLIKCRNLLIVFLVSGFWHGANWTFVVWGLLHGTAMIWETLFPGLRFKKECLNRLCTGIFVTLTFAVFRSDSLSGACQMFQKLFFGGVRGFFVGMCNTLQLTETYALRKMLELAAPRYLNIFYVGCMSLLLGIAVVLVRGRRAEEWIENNGRTWKGLFIAAAIFSWAFLSLSQVSTFLYFNF